MASPWLYVLKHVPWSDVIRNAPKLADGARKLWQTVARQPAPATPAPAAQTGDPGMTPDARIAALSQQVAELHAQMQASAELIQGLAEQNTELVRRIEANRRRTAWLYAFLVVLAVYLVWQGSGGA